MRLIIILSTIALCISNVAGFSLPQFRQASLSISTRRISSHVSLIQRTASPPITRLHSSPDDKQAEIEALEEKLRQLKGVDPAESVESSENSVVMQSTPDDVIEEEDEPEWAVLKTQSNDSVMMSERWKEASSSTNSDGGLLKNIAIALGLVVFLGVFSQVPIGNEDLQKYQDYKGSASRIDLGDLNPEVRVQLN